MQEITKPSETVEFLGSQKDDVSSSENLHTLSKAPKRNRRVLIINEEIQIELDDDESNDLSQLVEINNSCELLQIQSVEQEACLNYDIIKSKIDDVEICEMDLLNETKDQIVCERKNRDQNPKQQTSRVMDYDLEEYLSRMFRKIAPKDYTEDTSIVDSESWRINPPKKRNKKQSLYALMENFREQKIYSKKNLQAKQSQRIIPNSVNQLKPKKKRNKQKSTGLTESGNQEKVSHQNSLYMEDIEGDLKTPTIIENEVVKRSLIIPESNIDTGLVICPYCSYKNPKENILRKHLILYHLKTKNCTECFFHSSSWHVMALHMLKHKKKISQCPLCNKIIKSSMLKNHVVAKHSKTILEQCKFCDFKVEENEFIKQISSLREHVLSCHSKGIKDENNFFKCLKCTFIASSLTHLLNHTAVHKNGEQYYCFRCKFSNSSLFWMNLHKKNHLSVLYKCPYCEFRVKENYLLKYHIHKWHKNSSFRQLMKH